MDNPPAKKRRSAKTPNQQVMAVLPLEGLVLFPGGKLVVTVHRPSHLAMLEEAIRDHQELALVAQKRVGGEEAGADDLYRVGTAARVVNVSTRPGGTAALEVKGLRRVRIVDFVQKSPYVRARVLALPDGEGGVGVEKAAQTLRAAGAKRLRAESGPEAAARFDEIRQPGLVADAVAQLVDAPVAVKQALLEEPNVAARLKKTRRLLESQRKASQGRGLPGRHLLSYGLVTAVLGAQVGLTRPDWHQPMGAALCGALAVSALNLLVELWRWLR